MLTPSRPDTDAGIEAALDVADSQDDPRLKHGYASILAETAEINEEIGYCSSIERAYLYEMEETALAMPDPLTYPHLQEDTNSKHIGKIASAWNQLTRCRVSLTKQRESLTSKWEKPPPNIEDPNAAQVDKQSPLTIQPRFKNGILAMISDPKNIVPTHPRWRRALPLKARECGRIVVGQYQTPAKMFRSLLKATQPPTLNGVMAKLVEKTTPLSTRREELEQWQIDEKAARHAYFVAFRNYLTMLRGYYEMLLETNGTTGEKILDLEKENELRKQLAITNRYLQTVDATHMGMSIAKALHHGQAKLKMRKIEGVPYVIHELRVTNNTNFDVSPHVIEEDRMQIDLVILLLCAALHDLVEDSGMTMEYILTDILPRIANKADSTIARYISTSFPEMYKDEARNALLNLQKISLREQLADGEEMPSDEEINAMISDQDVENKIMEIFQNKVISLVSDSRLREIRQILKILSNNTELSIDQKRKALSSNIVDRNKVKSLFGISDAEFRNWMGPSVSEEREPRGLFTEFPEEYDEGKMTKFLIRLNSITTSPRAQQKALIIKLEDRADNLKSQWGLPIEKQLSNLRSASTRLIKWCMEEHDNTNWPLYDALPRIIDASLSEYQRLRSLHPRFLKEIDLQCIEMLTRWQTDVHRLEVPQKIQQLKERYQKSKDAIKRAA